MITEDEDPFCLTDAEAARMLRGAPWRRFAVIGDSLALGTGDPTPGYATIPWGDRVADVLRRVTPDLEYLNTGVLGATTPAVIEEQLVAMEAFAPDLVHVSTGANDIWRRDFDAVTLRRNLAEVFGRAAATGARLTTFALVRRFDVPAIADFPARVRLLNDLLRTLAREHGGVCVDMYDHPIVDRDELLSADGIHLAMGGHAVMAAEVARGLSGVLARTRVP